VLITTIRKDTARTEELVESEYRSLMWTVLQALQQIKSATRIEGEEAMSAPPFFQSAGRGDLLSWEGKEGPTVLGSNMREPIRTRKCKWMEEASTMHNWVVWCKSKRGGRNPLI